MESNVDALEPEGITVETADGDAEEEADKVVIPAHFCCRSDARKTNQSRKE